MLITSSPHLMVKKAFQRIFQVLGGSGHESLLPSSAPSSVWVGAAAIKSASRGRCLFAGFVLFTGTDCREALLFSEETITKLPRNLDYFKEYFATSAKSTGAFPKPASDLLLRCV